MREFGYASPMYGHFGQGCVHMRHNFDLESESRHPRTSASFIDRAADIASPTAAPSPASTATARPAAPSYPKCSVPKLMQAPSATSSALWDPTNRMNPGKLIDAHEPHADLRLGADFKPLAARHSTSPSPKTMAP